MEDGYTRTANALVEAFARAPLTSREARVIRVVERMTYGWNKPADWIAASVISQMTGMSEGKCSETLNGLIRKRVLLRDGGGRSPVRINKDIDNWDFSAQKARVTPKSITKSTWGKSPQNGVSNPPQDGDTPKDIKDNLEPKGSKNTSKKSAPKKWGEEIDHKLVNEMVVAVSADLESPVKHNPTTWANEFRLMRQRDNRTVEQIRYLIGWAAKHEFWSGVVLCPEKLRRKWDQLAKQAKAQHQQRTVSRQTPGRHSGLQEPDTSNLVAKGDGTYEF
ncbi:replication protein [Phytohalomonas tamaricis]|uniref:replication protein n=1 Tax=Phytohalomonas tamaricis TaxID=2081032 RepID=UPI00131A23D6|nr:replication protein [Phytohalomonas tamaricis]